MDQFTLFAITDETPTGLTYVDEGTHSECMATATFLYQKPEGTFPFAGHSFQIIRNPVQL